MLRTVLGLFSYLGKDFYYDHRTEGKEITFHATGQQSVTISLPSGVRFHNVSTGSTSTPGAKVTIQGCTKFYLSAPLTQAEDTAEVFASTMAGSLKKDYSAYKLTTNSSTQDLAFLFGKGVETTNNAKKFQHGEEYGSARWGNRKDIEPFEDPVFENNIILTETERLTMNSRPKAPKYARNKNVIVIGGSGSGKTRFYVKPNLMQMTDHVSYVVTDPKGSARRSSLKRIGTSQTCTGEWR